MKKWLTGFASFVIAAPAFADPHIDIHGLVEGAAGARFVKGIPTIDLPLQNGAVQVRPLGFDHSDTVFAVAVYNASNEPANIALEDMHANVDGSPVRIWTGQDLARQAKNRAMWAQIGIAFIAGVGGALAASQRTTYRSSYSTPHSTYTFRGSYPSIAGQIQANDIAANGAFAMASIQQRLDFALANIDASVVQRTTVDPGMSYGAIVVVDKVDYGKAPLVLHLNVDWNGERYPFSFLLTRAGQSAPPEFVARLAENTKPRTLMMPRQAHASLSAATAAGPAQPPEGAIYLPSGAVKIPAKTASGYCLEAPADYVATGDLNYPIIDGALPRCEFMKKAIDSAWHPAKH